MSARGVAAADLLVGTIVIVAAIASVGEPLAGQLAWLSGASIAVLVSFAVHIAYLLRVRIGIAVLAKRSRDAGDG